MIPALIVAAATAALLAAWWWHSTHGELAVRAKRTVIVTLRTQEAFRGVLYRSDRDCLVLREAEAIGFGPEGTNAVVQGEVVLLRENVAYLQAT